MHKKVSVIAISILLILNFIVVKMYVKNKDSKINGIQKVYILQGKNQNWSVENYKIIISFHEFKTGWGEVHIIADKNDFNINDLTVYQLDIIKVDKVNSEKKDTLISKSISTNVPGMCSEDNLNCGVISNEGKTELNNYNLEEKYDIYANIKYKIKDGGLIEEKFKLNIVTAISETDNKIKVLKSK